MVLFLQMKCQLTPTPDERGDTRGRVMSFGQRFEAFSDDSVNLQKTFSHHNDFEFRREQP